jgi:hypothetical protein
MFGECPVTTASQHLEPVVFDARLLQGRSQIALVEVRELLRAWKAANVRQYLDPVLG